jgi:phosphoglycerate kinase
MITKDHLKNKNVLLRLDLDVPVKDGLVVNEFRLQASLKTIKFCLENARKTIIIGHLGRPNGSDPTLSLEIIRKSLNILLNRDIPLIPSGFSPGERWTGESPLLLQENIRFDPREEKNDRGYAEELVFGADLYVYDSFANYRISASLTQIPEVIPTLTGFRFDEEVSTLKKVINDPPRPSLLIVSGAKLDKLDIIKKIMPHFDQVFLGGKLGKPEDRTPDGLDISEKTTSLIVDAINMSRTIVLNGPLGYYEDGVHGVATKTVLQAIIDSKVFSVIGGGDTLAAIPSLGFEYTSFNFVSTGGGAMLEFLATGTHPLLETLKSAKV